MKKFVALLAEGVDRNGSANSTFSPWFRSPSSRRAWIEIFRLLVSEPRSHVALLAEGVDRNLSMQATTSKRPTSPSSRRAWIEIAVP